MGGYSEIYKLKFICSIKSGKCPAFPPNTLTLTIADNFPSHDWQFSFPEQREGTY